tara:strand:- start:213 stop:368 length:156 start_codon:yes stop_codon:yes gene_type:complete
MSLYKNMNKRKAAGTSRSVKNSTIDPKTYSMMSRKVGGFDPNKDKKKKEKA